MADSYNELFGLGTHSADADLEKVYLCQDDAASNDVADLLGGAVGFLNGGDTTDKSTTGGPDSNYLPLAFDLDGTGDYIGGNTYTVDLATDDAATVMMRFKSGDTSGETNEVSAALFALENNHFAASIRTSGKLWIYTNGGNTGTNASEVVDDSAWHTAMFVFDQGNNVAAIYVDGALDYEDTSYTDNSTGTGQYIRFGASGSYEFTGQIADCVFGKRVYTLAEYNEWENGPEPVNTVAPTISGTAQVGKVLVCDDGTWDIDSAISGTNGTIVTSRQWTRSNDGSGTGEADISGATGIGYLLQSADDGKYIRCRVRGSNSGGYDSAADTNTAFTSAVSAVGTVTVALLDDTQDAGTANSVTSTAIDTTGATLLVAGVSIYANTPSTDDFSDNQGNSWTLLTEATDSTHHVAYFYCLGPKTNASHTVSYSKTESYSSVSFAAFGGISAYEAETGNNGDTLTALKPGSATPTTADSVVLTALTYSASTSTEDVAIDESMTEFGQVNPTTAVNLALMSAYKIAAASLIDPEWTWTTSRDNCAAVLAVFKPFVGGGGGGISIPVVMHHRRLQGVS